MFLYKYYETIKSTPLVGLFMRRERYAKITATLGPTTDNEHIIEELFLKGVDVFRLNFSHGQQEDHKHRIQIIRSLEQKYNYPTTILLDLQGPKLRIGNFDHNKITLKEGQTFCLDTINKPGNHDRVQLPHPEIFGVFKAGQHLLLDDGKIKLEVIEAGSDFILTQVIKGGILQNRKGVNLPDTKIPIPALTEKDKKDLEFGLSLDIDWVALSFVQTPQDVKEAKKLIDKRAKLIVKIEKPQAILELDKIVSLADGVLVARGDLGVEMALEEVPILQKKIIRTCQQYSKPVIVATQMLESMIHEPTPTRAEVSDVATAIYEGADGVMLSAETAIGKYPIQSVEMMDSIIKHIEKEQTTWHNFYRVEEETDKKTIKKENICDAIINAMHTVSYDLSIKTLVVFSLSGNTAIKAASARPKSPILVLTTNIKTARYLSLIWGIHAITAHEVFSFPQMVQSASKSVEQEKLCTKGDLICIVSGIPFGKSGGANIVHITKVNDEYNDKNF